MKKVAQLFVFLCVFSAIAAIAQQNNVVVVPLISNQKVAKSGETFTGQLSYFHQPSTVSSWGIAGASFPKPLPAGTARPSLEFLTTTSTNCPGIGQAASGYLCVYTYNTHNFSQLSYSGNSTDENRLYGFSLDIVFEIGSSTGWIISSWAYTVP